MTAHDFAEAPEQPGSEDPSTVDPGTEDPSRKDPSRKDPSRKDPSRKDPSRKDPSRKDPATGHAEPELDDAIAFEDLDDRARQELRSLPRGAAENVGRHLVAVTEAVETDPSAALAHARYAKSRAPRIPVVREALGVAAYRAGQWSEALREFRALRRMSNSLDYLPLMADVERALGRPQRAVDVAREARSLRLPEEVAVELRIVAAGALRDMGQLDAAMSMLDGSQSHAPKLAAPLRSSENERLHYAYADALVAAGRTAEALTWFRRAAEADVDGATDAAERAADLIERQAAAESRAEAEPGPRPQPELAIPERRE